MTNRDTNTNMLTRGSVQQALECNEKGANGLVVKGIPAVKITGKSGFNSTVFKFLETPTRKPGIKGRQGKYVLIVPPEHKKFFERRQGKYGFTIEDVTITLKELTDVEKEILTASPANLAIVLNMVSEIFMKKNRRTGNKEPLRDITKVIVVEPQPEPEPEKVTNKGGK